MTINRLSMHHLFSIGTVVRHLGNWVHVDLAGWDSHILLPVTSNQIIITRMMNVSGSKIMPNPSLAKVAGGAHGTNDSWSVLQQTQFIVLTTTCTTARLTLQYVQLGHTFRSNCNT